MKAELGALRQALARLNETVSDLANESATMATRHREFMAGHARFVKPAILAAKEHIHPDLHGAIDDLNAHVTCHGLAVHAACGCADGKVASAHDAIVEFDKLLTAVELAAAQLGTVALLEPAAEGGAGEKNKAKV